MARKIKLGNVVLCEHVVASGNNKHTLVNVYSGDIVVEEFPAVLTFGIYIELLKENNIEKITFFLKNGRKEIGKAQAAFPEPETGVLAIPFLPFRTESATTFEIVAEAPGFGRSSILKKQIFTLDA